MNELNDTLNHIQGQELQNLIVLLKNIGRLTAAGTFLIALAHLYVLYTRAGRIDRTVKRSGMIFLMFAVFIWLSMAAGRLFFNVHVGEFNLLALFSTFNNGFLIASVPFIGDGFLWIRKIRLFRNRLVWVISALIFSMVASMLLILLGRIAPDFSQKAEIAFSMFSMLLFGYAAFTSFKSSRAKIGSLIIIATAPVGYALLQIILNQPPTDRIAQFWIIAIVTLTVANSAMSGMFLLTSANEILGSLENMLTSNKAKMKKLEDQHLLATTQAQALLAETQALRALLLEKDQALQAMQAEADPKAENVHLQSMRIAFERNSIDKYIIELVLVLGNDEEVRVKCANSKLTVPHAHWIIFAAARKNGIPLRHPDIAQNKFQMIKYLNAFTGKYKITQEQVFRNNGGEFDINLDQNSIAFEDIEQYADHLQLLETFKKYWQSFGITGGTKNSQEAFIEALTTMMRSE